MLSSGISKVLEIKLDFRLFFAVKKNRGSSSFENRKFILRISPESKTMVGTPPLHLFFRMNPMA